MKLSGKTKALFIVVSVIFGLYALSLVFPFLYTLNNSFKTNSEFINDVWALPEKFSFDNYIEAFQENNLISMFFNTIFLTACGTFLSVMSASVMAYVLSKYKFTGSGLIYTVAILVMVIPNLGNVAATYKLMNNLGLVDSLPGLLVLYLAPFGSTFLLLYSFFKGISWSYAEAAKIDGAGNFTIFFRIMLPQAKAGIGAVGFMVMIGLWNDYYTPFLYLPSMYTLATGLQDLSVQATTTGAYTQMFAAMIISIVPLLVLFGFCQKTIMENTVAGGLKG